MGQETGKLEAVRVTGPGGVEVRSLTLKSTARSFDHCACHLATFSQQSKLPTKACPVHAQVKGMFGGEKKADDDDSDDDSAVREKKKPKTKTKPKPFTAFLPRRVVKPSNAGAKKPVGKSQATAAEQEPATSGKEATKQPL